MMKASIGIAVGTFVLLLGPLASSSFALQPDGPFLAYKERKASEWAKDDEQIAAKLDGLQKRFGKRPNIIYILTDDIGWGELGWQGGGRHRGTPTPTLDKLAFEGMRFWSAYAEPSCTPTRIAIMTGRHPVRTGLLSVLWPGQTDGWSPDEVTIAEVLSDAGYHTGMWGKWHLGEEAKFAPFALLADVAPDRQVDACARQIFLVTGKVGEHERPGLIFIACLPPIGRAVIETVVGVIEALVFRVTRNIRHAI